MQQCKCYKEENKTKNKCLCHFVDQHVIGKQKQVIQYFDQLKACIGQVILYVFLALSLAPNSTSWRHPDLQSYLKTEHALGCFDTA